MPKFSCDFETTTNTEDCRVWAWVAIEIGKKNDTVYGKDINEFMNWALGSNKTLYFHNLKFDGEFILHWLLTHNFILSKERNPKDGEFTTLISDKGMFYSINVKFDGVIIHFLDSLKLLPYSVSEIAKGFKLPISKLSLDYKAEREVGHELTQDEKDYIRNDGLIVALALSSLFDEGFTKMTTGSNAMNFYKKSLGGIKHFRKIFPIPDNDPYIRKSYKGGFTYVNPKFQSKIIREGRVYDVNSLYPYVLHSPFPYPYGKGKYFAGQYKHDEEMPLYFQRIVTMFTVKDNHIPTIQLKRTLGFMPTEYVTDSGGKEVELTLTKPDLELFLDHYDPITIRYIDGYKYAAKEGLFDEYINGWYERKNRSKQEKNFAMYQLSKLMLNSLYGKFATSPKCSSKYPYLKDDGTVGYYIGEEESREPVYIPVGAYVTAYARNVTIRAAQKVYDRFIYADTDSLHLEGDFDPVEIDVDEYRLGAFKHEGTFDKAKFLRSKLYMEHIREPQDPPGTEHWKLTGAGMPPAVKEQITFEDFDVGLSIQKGKLRPKHCVGGIVLVDTPFTIKEK